MRKEPMKIPRTALLALGVLITAALLATLVLPGSALAGKGNVKVTICHIPPGNPANAHTITIGEPAVAPHLALHGDTLGPCDGGGDEDEDDDDGEGGEGG